MSDQERQFNLQRIYTKDLSFESPNAPQVFLEDMDPEISVSLDNTIKQLQEGVFEVVLHVSAEAKGKTNGKTVFMVEVQQGGIFATEGFSEDELGPMLGIAAPNILFPYAREVISDLVSRGSFPQFLLSPVNFEAIYHRRMQQAAEQAGNA